jgi:hypothetical protein
VKGEACTEIRWGNLEEKDQWENPDIDGRIIVRWIFKKWDVGFLHLLHDPSIQQHPIYV